MRSGRRRFLGWLVAGAMAGSTGLALVRASGYEVAAGVASKLRVLRPWHYVVVRAVGARIVSPHTVDVGLFIDEYLVSVARADRRDVLRFIAYVEHVAPLAYGRGSRYSRLGPEAQDEVLRHLEASSLELIRAGFQALKALALMAAYRQPGSWQKIGYDGPAIDGEAS